VNCTTDCHLDWLRYTVPWVEQQNELENLNRSRPGIPLFDMTGESVDIGQGYDRGVRMNSGMMFWHTTRHEQGIGVQLSGMDMQELRHSEVSEADMLRFIAAVGGRVSTMHSCINIHNGGADVRQLIDAHAAGKTVARARQVGVYTSKTKVGENWVSGETFYVGSAKSAIQIRVYNKAAEQGIEADWTRLEIVWRGRHARAVHAQMIMTGIAAVTRGAIMHQISTELPWWKLAMRGELTEPEMMRRKPSARYAWLMSVVLAALESEIAEAEPERRAELRAAYRKVIDAKHPRER
jgi:hypothetical protein